MSLSAATLKPYLTSFNLTKLFTQELGWDKYSREKTPPPLTVVAGNQTLALRGLVVKRGVQVFECPGDADGKLLDYPTRRLVEKEVTKSAAEHLIVFTDAAKTAQVWQWVKRVPGQPAAYREVFWRKGQSAEALAQKLGTISVALSDEEALTLGGTVTRLKDAFDRDKVTKKFFDHFHKEHGKFLAFITGVVSQGDRAWYASLMLNRLMFVYFIQKKGFLDGDRDYLRNRLATVRERNVKFHNFYRAFLMKLFREGFGKRAEEREFGPELSQLIGTVPYLNGGLFDLHELEANNAALDIPDEAFANLFAFFDQYEWHLDSRALAKGNEINPDVLGHIFEKFVNQKQMGAYYTKEDITDYIGKNTIIPRLFDAARPHCEIAFAPGSALWKLLADNPDRYLYAAVRHGIDVPLPADIARGVADVAQRGGWNRAAPPEFALPTETWREHVARRQRALGVRAKLAAGEVTAVNDLITLNLDIRQFASDAIAGCEGPELLRAFTKAVQEITVLDPTCGSGAFLFAALNILQPLYDACLDRMAAFVADADPKAFTDFRLTLKDAEAHPSRDYFVLKSIVVRNLYGVDIMAEAVEICKLRLFLKLVAQVETVEQLEPLPDIDFNIRAGNTLVGFATKADAQKAFAKGFDFEGGLDKVEKAADDLARQFRLFQDFQTSLQDGKLVLNYGKSDLRAGLAKLRATLDAALAGVYGIDPEDAAAFAAWRASHQPFHWFAEFYAIMASGGFDVIVGNPPYVEYSKVRNTYQLLNFKTIATGNLFANVVERCYQLTNRSRLGLILPLSLVCTDRMSDARGLLSQGTSWIPNFDMRPGSLFEGVAQRLTVLIQDIGDKSRTAIHAGGYRRWAVAERADLLALTQFCPSPSASPNAAIGKLSHVIEASILGKIGGPSISAVVHHDGRAIYVHRICRYFIKALDFIPHFTDADGKAGKSEDYKLFQFEHCDAAAATCLLNSTLFYWFWRSFGDGFHCGYGDVYRMPFSSLLKGNKPVFAELNTQLMNAFKNHSVIKSMRSQKGSISYQEFSPTPTKPILDEIDRVFAEHYGFTPEELDFIINYDIKYRLGADAGEDDS